MASTGFPSYLPHPVFASVSDGKLSFEDYDGSVDIEQASKQFDKRPKIICRTIPKESLETVLNRFGFFGEGLQKIYRALGQGDCEMGREAFFKKFKDRELTIERIGFTEKGPKFYLVVGCPIADGDSHCVFSGYSTAGTFRIIHQAHEEMVENFEAAQHLSHKSHPASEVICRLKRYEHGVSVSEAGGEDLWTFEIGKLSDRARLGLYLLLLRNLALFHQSGFAHRDLKIENIVVCRNDAQEISEVKFIDLESLAQDGTRAMFEGTDYFSSYTQLVNLRDSFDRKIPVDQKDDVWGMGIVLCNLETMALNGYPENGPLIHPRILDRYNGYVDWSIGLWKSYGKNGQYPAQMIRYLDNLGGKNLFDNMSLDKEYPLDPLILQMGKLHNIDRPSAQQLLNGCQPLIEDK